MDPPVEHSFLRFSRGCVSLSPLSLSAALRLQPRPGTMHASFCVVCFHQDPDDGSGRTVRLPSLVFFLPLLPPVLSFTLLLLHAASFFSRQHLALPFFLLSPLHLILSLYPPSSSWKERGRAFRPFSNPPSRTMKPKIFSWHLGNAGT